MFKEAMKPFYFFNNELIIDICFRANYCEPYKDEVCECELFCFRHAQALAALQAYSHWLARFYSEVHSQNQSQFHNLITSTIDASSPLITAKVAFLFLQVVSI